MRSFYTINYTFFSNFVSALRTTWNVLIRKNAPFFGIPLFLINAYYLSKNRPSAGPTTINSTPIKAPCNLSLPAGAQSIRAGLPKVFSVISPKTDLLMYKD